MPPGPWGIPFLGVFYKISPDGPHLTYAEWAKKYGDVMSFTLFGTQRAVVVNSEEAIRDVLVNKQDQFSGNTLFSKRKATFPNYSILEIFVCSVL